MKQFPPISSALAAGMFSLFLTSAGQVAAQGPMPAGAAEAPGAPVLQLEVVKSTNTDGNPGELGVLSVTRASEAEVMRLSWKYADGSVIKGWGVPYPDSGLMAIGYGSGILGVAMYKREGDDVDALWAPANDSAKLIPYKMTKGASDSEYLIENDGGKFQLAMGENMMGTAKWTLPQGEFSGLALAEGSYLAVVSMAPDANGGVGLYKLDMAQGTASGRWALKGSTGVGTEELKVISPGAPVVGSPAPSAGAGTAEEAAVRGLAQAFFKDVNEFLKLKPNAEQIAAIAATEADAQALAAYADKVYAELGSITVARANQTEVLVVPPDKMPGGYGSKAQHFKPGTRFWGFKYVVPGETIGMSYNGLYQVDGQWVFIPKAWRAFD